MSNQQKTKTVNPIPPGQPPQADPRTTRHLRQCAELADLAMQLARAAAARTLANWAEPEHPPAAAPPTAQVAKQTDPAVLFTRLAAVVRDCVALEARLAAGSGPAPRAAALQLRADPRRAPLREAFRRATEHHPDRAELLRETTTRIDEQLAADPDQKVRLANLYFPLCDELGIEIDLSILPDEFLILDPEPARQNEAAPRAPDPRATSPP
jgi:hypothetical protein